jgi:cytochrome c5
MAIQYSVAVNNARLDTVESTTGTTAVLKIFSGAVPANCAAADPTGTLVTITLPSDWMNNASAGSKTKLGTWSGTAAAAGTAASFRIYESTATTCHIQGSCGIGTGDLQLDNTSIANGQTVTVNTFTLNAANT